MSEWKEVSLADVCRKPQYGAIAKGVSDPVGPRFVRQTDISSNRIDWSSVPYCDLDQAEFDKYAIHTGDLLISRLGAGVGLAATVRESRGAVFAGYLVRFQTDASLAVPEFVGYQLQSERWRDHVRSFRSGAAQPTLNAQQMAAFRFLLPPKAVQHRIAATLGALDDKVQSNQRSIDLGLALLDALAVAAANDIPEVVALGEAAVVSRETTDPTGFGTTAVDHFSIPAFDDAGWPERIDASSIMSNKLLIGRECILVSRLNPRFNRTWWCVPEDGVPALASTEFLALSTVKPEDLGSLWLALRDEFFREELMRRVTGTSGSHQRIRPDDALSIEVLDVRLVSDDRKRQALDLLALVHQRRDENRRLARLRDALLPELLSGRVRVPDAAQVPEGTAP